MEKVLIVPIIIYFFVLYYRVESEKQVPPFSGWDRRL
jgi:hypothetical protein